MRLLFILLLVLCGYYSKVAAIQGWHSFPWKPRDINDSWIMYIQVRRWRLLDRVSSILSVLLSAVGTTHTTLALAWWSSSEIIHTRLLGYYSRRCLFRSRASDCFEGGDYSKKNGTRSSEKFTSTYEIKFQRYNAWNAMITSCDWNMRQNNIWFLLVAFN